MADDPSGRAAFHHALAWLAAILILAGTVKFAAMPGYPPYGVDASYYFQIANHVARGHGFVTTVSLYHEGLVLPSPSQIYPLWPLLLGYTGRAIGIVSAANLLPPVFYLLSLILLYALSRAVAASVGRLRWSERWYVPDAGHLIVALFAMNISYFGATTHPYTEGLSFTLAFASFLALHRFVSANASSWAFVAGCAAGLAYLGRSQMVAVAVGTIPVLLVAGWRNRALWRGLIVYLCGAFVVVLPWILYLGRVPGLRFLGEWKTVPRVAVPLYFEPGEFATTSSHLKEALSALSHAFNFASDMSFTRTFGPAALLPLVAAVVALWLMRRRTEIEPAGASRVVTYSLILAGLFIFAVLVFFPAAFGLRHLFGWRHGLTHLFLIIPAIPFFFNRGRAWALIATIAMVISIGLGARAVYAFVRYSPTLMLRPSENAALSWLDAQKRVPKVLTTNAQILGSLSDAHLHWTDCNSPGASTRGMVEKLRIDYVWVYERERRCAFVDGVFSYLKVVQRFEDPQGQRVYLLAPR